MIVNDLNLEGVRAALDETKTELIVDADAVLSGAIALQGFKVVAGRCGHGGQVVVITILHAVAPAYVHMRADEAIACSKISRPCKIHFSSHLHGLQAPDTANLRTVPLQSFHERCQNQA